MVGGCISSSPAAFARRFDFLQSWHQFNSYYEFKKNYFLQKEGRCFPEVGPPRGEEASRLLAAAASANPGLILAASSCSVCAGLRQANL